MSKTGARYSRDPNIVVFWELRVLLVPDSMELPSHLFLDSYHWDIMMLKECCDYESFCVYQPNSV